MVLYDCAMTAGAIEISKTLAQVKYEIRGKLAHRAYELEKRGYEILSLNIGNPGLFGYRTPETMRLAMIENLGQYAFIRFDVAFDGKLDDRAIALELLENKHVLVAPGNSLKTPYTDHIRITTLPDPDVKYDVFARIEAILEQRA